MTPTLQPYASRAECSKGRLHPEAPAPTRDDYQRDRDRIVHSTAFRRLAYKTQVFLNHEGDLFRTRMTHSLEVAQLARSMARSLALNEDLCEAISLAHDLGHTPFGHAGQDALDACAKALDQSSGGFEHNFQGLRLVDSLEERYAAFNGLNLTFETREGILKHCSNANAHRLELHEPHGVGLRFLNKTQPSLEAQLCHLADELTYNAHDIDDGVRSGVLTLPDVAEIPMFARFHAEARRDCPDTDQRRLLFETIRRLLSASVSDLVETTKDWLMQYAPENAEEVRTLPMMVHFSPAMSEEGRHLKHFLRTALYRHPRVTATTDVAKQVVRDLFEVYHAEPSRMPVAPRAEADRTRSVCDYIAGMTDRFALREHFRLTGRRVFD